VVGGSLLSNTCTENPVSIRGEICVGFVRIGFMDVILIKMRENYAHLNILELGKIPGFIKSFV
jgi:hypothetical protein